MRPSHPPRPPSPATVLFCHDGENWLRGSERVLLQLMERLDRRRFRPVLWCTQPALAQAARDIGAEVIMGQGWHEASTARWPDRALVRESLDIIRRHDVRLVHANVIDPVKWLLVAARTARIPLLVHVHMPSDAVERRLAWLHQASMVIGVSRTAAQGLLEDGMPAGRVRIVHNGVDEAQLAAGDASGLRKERGIPADAFVVTFVGSLIAPKAVDVLLAAFERLASRRPDAHLLLVGEGDKRGELAAQALAQGLDGRVHFLGERRDVGAILRDATDVLASASDKETFQMTLAEAAMCGKPVVAAAVPAHYEVVVDGETGLLVPPRDPGAMAAALLTLAADPARRRMMGDAGKLRAQGRFTTDRIVQQVESAYTELLGRPRRAYGWLAGWTWPAEYWKWAAAAIGRRVATRVSPRERERGSSAAPAAASQVMHAPVPVRKAGTAIEGGARVYPTITAQRLDDITLANILFVHDGEDWVRGSERSMLQVIEFLDRRRFHPIVWCTEPAMAEASREAGAEVIMGKGWHEAAAARWPDRALVRESLDIIRRHDVRLVHANVIDPVKWLLVAARTARIPLLVHVHMPSDAVERRLMGTHQAARIVGVSRASVQGYLDDGMGEDRVKVIYNGVDRRRMAGGGAVPLREQLGIAPDALVVTFVGSLVVHKAVDVLLAAFAMLVRQHPTAQLVIVGDGPLRGALEAQAAAPGLSGHVHFLGARKDVGVVLREVTDIFASASRVETFQNTLAEAAICGVPAIATTIPPHFEVVLPGETGLLVPPDDPAAMAEALLTFARDDALRRRCGEAARARAMRLFSIERAASEFEAEYDALLAEPRASYGWLGRWTWPRAYWDWIRSAVARRLGGRTSGGNRAGGSPDADALAGASAHGGTTTRAASHAVEQRR